MSNDIVPMFVHIEFGPDQQQPYPEQNFGTLYYEIINMPFMLFKTYLDILGRII